MNIIMLIKNVKDELERVKVENKKFNNEDVKENIKYIEEDLKLLEQYMNGMLELDDNAIYYKEMAKSTGNMCYEFLASSYFQFYLNTGNICDIDTYQDTKKLYESEENRLNSCKV